MDYEKIEQYLSGDMPETERTAFEAALAADPALASELQLYKTIQDELSIQVQQQEEQNALQQTLTEAGKKYFTTATQPAKVVSMGNRKIWYSALAAAAAIALFFIIRPMLSKSIMSNDQLYQQYAQAEPLDLEKRGTAADSVLIKMKTLYNSKDYAAALKLAPEAIAADPADISLKLALAHCYTETGNYTAAIPLLDSIAGGQSVYKYQALFYKALTYLKQDKKADCIHTLESIPADAVTYKDAQSLMGKLK